MSELTEQEKIQRRREKRQQRILNSAGDRLSRITGTAYPHRETPTPSPTTSSSSINKTDTKQDITRSRSSSPGVFPQPTTSSEGIRSRHAPPISTPSLSTATTTSYLDEDPSEALGAPQPLDPFNMFNMSTPTGGLGQGNNGELGPDINELFAQGGFPLNNPLFASMLQNAAGGNPSATMSSSPSNISSSTDPSLKYWNIFHLLSMMLLGFYAIYLEWSTMGMNRLALLLQSNSGLSYSGIHVPLFWYFVTIELCLQSARLFYQKGGVATNSTLGAIATQLPPPFNNIITVLLRYRLIWSCLVQDCCVLVFIIGFAQVVSALLV